MPAITYNLIPILTTGATPNYHLPSMTILQAHPQLQQRRYLKDPQLLPLPLSLHYNKQGLQTIRHLLCNVSFVHIQKESHDGAFTGVCPPLACALQSLTTLAKAWLLPTAPDNIVASGEMSRKNDAVAEA